MKFSKEINGARIAITGISADSGGNYAFDDLQGEETINLIEIEIPDKLDKRIEEEITRIAIAIASEYSWCVYDHETSSMIFP